MTPLQIQFLTESRDLLAHSSDRLLQLERSSGDGQIMSELFRAVHTLKGNSGLFDYPEMTRVLHGAEDLMSAVRDGRTAFNRAIADRLLEAMDLVGTLLDEIAAGAESFASFAGRSAELAAALRNLITPGAPRGEQGMNAGSSSASGPHAGDGRRKLLQLLASLPESARPLAQQTLMQHLEHGTDRDTALTWVRYEPEADCFFKGEDPFHLARLVPEAAWHAVSTHTPWPALADLDPYRCTLRFDVLSRAPRTQLEEHFRYVSDQVHFTTLVAADLRETPSASPPSPQTEAILADIVSAQQQALTLPHDSAALPGTLRGIAATLRAVACSASREDLLAGLDAALAASLAAHSAAPLVQWLATAGLGQQAVPPATVAPTPGAGAAAAAGENPGVAPTLKVDQARVDRLMGLIGEMVVAKNALPFLAARADTVFGSRELAREIKAQHAVINRIAEEMQDAIMQVRMMPVSTVFQRFPRLVRDISRKLGKEVTLILEGEGTEADKNVIEALADPLIHIVRNSLDHGIENPEARRAAGKPAEGKLRLRATQDSGRIHIDVSDDGKGIDPAVIKRKAFEKGLIDAATMQRLTDQAAINLVFAAGFSTAEAVSDLSGRGVGMDVVRTAVERLNGTVSLHSTLGQGTGIRISLPLSMAVTHVMVVESNGQAFGVPMELVRETVRVPSEDIRAIQNRQTTVLRNHILPLRSLNEMLQTGVPQKCNAQGEMAAIVVEVQGQPLGILVDAFREVADIILKPMGGILSSLPGYSGSALLGDGSVLMVLDPKELATWH